MSLFDPHRIRSAGQLAGLPMEVGLRSQSAIRSHISIRAPLVTMLDAQVRLAALCHRSISDVQVAATDWGLNGLLVEIAQPLQDRIATGLEISSEEAIRMHTPRSFVWPTAVIPRPTSVVCAPYVKEEMVEMATLTGLSLGTLASGAALMGLAKAESLPQLLKASLAQLVACFVAAVKEGLLVR